MTILQALILGIIQGLTEFLPISSSAHLVIAPYILDWQIPAQQEFIFDVLVQVGTLLAVITYFWKDLVAIVRAFLLGLVHKQPFADPLSRLGWYLILATIPAIIIGAAIKNMVEQAFNNPIATAIFLIVTAALLIIAERFGQRNRQLEHLTWKDSLVIGLFQVLSLFPGVSRSGSTITGGMVRNLDRRTAARFSFLMSVPVMLGAGLWAIKDLVNIPNLSSYLPVVAVGILAAALVGYLSIRWLLSYLTHRPLYIFAIYCFVLCLIVLGIALARSL
jgi:undecaprenyl-diphosphatase